MGMTRIGKVIAAALAGAMLCSAAPQRGVPPAGEGLIALKAARLFDATSERLREDAVVLVRDGRIVGIGASADIPAGTQVIDLGDATLLPGFIDAHSHLTLESDADYYRHVFKQMMRTQSEQAFYAGANAKVTLEAGFTTVRHVGARYFIDIGLRNAINAGLTPGPRILASGNPITARGGSCDQPPFPAERVAPKTAIDGVCSGGAECREAVRHQMNNGADAIKICVSGGVLSWDPVDVPQLTREEITAAVEEAHNWGRKVAAHAHGDTAARIAIEAGVDSIEHGSFLSEATLRLMKAKGVFLVPTCTAIDWVETHSGNYPPNIAEKAITASKAHHEMLRMAIRIGVPIAAGTDMSVVDKGHGKNAIEMVLLTRYGMRPAAALIAGTREAARLLGVADRVGTIETGKDADIVVVAGNPVADIAATQKPVLVMQRGRIVMRKTG